MTDKKNTLPRVAYFCMEYGLDTRFKAYAGGLGILAGDYMKGAKAYDYPIVGIGIKWKQGYTDQLIGEDGKPYDTYHNYNYDDFMEDTGVSVNVSIRGRSVQCKVWKLVALAAALHLARTVARRAERAACALAEREDVNREAIRYLNRVSDLLFVAARVANADGRDDVLWVPGKNR